MIIDQPEATWHHFYIMLTPRVPVAVVFCHQLLCCGFSDPEGKDTTLFLLEGRLKYVSIWKRKNKRRQVKGRERMGRRGTRMLSEMGGRR